MNLEITVRHGSVSDEVKEHAQAKLDRLLSSILKRWPDAEFLTVRELVAAMAGQD